MSDQSEGPGGRSEGEDEQAEERSQVVLSWTRTLRTWTTVNWIGARPVLKHGKWEDGKHGGGCVGR